MKANKHYGKKYYLWQKKMGQLAADTDLWKFEKFINKNDKVLDFGCGGGYILEKLNCKKKYGVEINPVAIEEAKKRNIEIFTKIDDIPFALRFDSIISHHALEHIEDPFIVLKTLKKYLKNKGKMIWVVPIDDWRIQKKYTEDDINQHYFTWTPLILGNLFARAGYKVKDIEIFTHVWIPFSNIFLKIIPKPIYFFLCKIWSAITLNRQMRIIALKK
ncbi:MAG: class I SAM-dependent methyltransferase [Patescibacteria group bacterium]|nr:class I SAM-dependent methyltransferase [Patescibacteria group bacterium]